MIKISTKKKTIEWFKLFEFFCYFVIAPTLLLFIISSYYPAILSLGYYSVLVIILLQAAWSNFQTFQALKRRYFKERKGAEHASMPKTTFIVSAYLPNEVAVIEKTLLNILKNVIRPDAGIEVIIAYNTPTMMGIEPRLRELAYMWPELILANAYGSRSKSENINYALDIASGKMIVLLDADHIVLPDCLRRAWRWLDEGYDVVQGRCIIRNGNESAVSAMVEVEFEGMYGVSHSAKSLTFDSALFGGSNGFWKAAVLKKMRFQTEYLTEDIDCTIRTLLAGYKIVHDRSIISEELAPVSLTALWYQRKRWSQGWFQVALKYWSPILTTHNLNFWQKFMWLVLLEWRIFYDIASQFLVPILLTFWLYSNSIILPVNGFIVFAIFFTLSSGVFEVFAAYKNAANPNKSFLRYAWYVCMMFPYTIYKNIISLIAIRDEIFGSKEWIVSSRE
jgi:hypothetical protein